MTVLICQDSFKRALTDSGYQLEALTKKNTGKVKHFLTHDKHLNPMLESDGELEADVLRAKDAAELIKSSVKGNFCKILTKDGAVQAVVMAEKSSFDTQHFGFGVGKIKFFSATEQLADEQGFQARNLLIKLSEDWMKENDVKCTITRMDLNDADGVLSLERNGFTMFDVLTTLNLHADKSSQADGDVSRNVETRIVRSADESVLMKIARQTFRNDHFHRDPLFPKERSDELFAKWIYNCCHGLADAVIVAAGRHGRPVGFITCRRKHGKGGYGVIDLVSVSPLHQGKGVGKLLVREACRWFSMKGTLSVFVGTQVSNLAAVRMYQDIGFRIASTEVTFHKWLGD